MKLELFLVGPSAGVTIEYKKLDTWLAYQAKNVGGLRVSRELLPPEGPSGQRIHAIQFHFANFDVAIVFCLLDLMRAEIPEEGPIVYAYLTPDENASLNASALRKAKEILYTGVSEFRFDASNFQELGEAFFPLFKQIRDNDKGWFSLYKESALAKRLIEVAEVWRVANGKLTVSRVATVFVDIDRVPPDDVARLVAVIDRLHRALGGAEIEIRDDGSGMVERQGVPL
ncbi:MAG TPA: hypothetical protein VK171_01910 [Fimbriimonas sp.]|nr:hypothetical protein [Fimbriimonas sp.]